MKNSIKFLTRAVLILFAFISFSTATFSQNYTKNPGYFESTGLRPTYGLRLPIRDTVPLSGKIDSSGSVIYRLADSTVYIKEKNGFWSPIRSGLRNDSAYILNQFSVEQNANAWFKDLHVSRIGIGRTTGRLFEAVSGTALLAWNGKNLSIADDTTSGLNTWVGYKTGISASGGQNTAYGYAAAQGLNGNWNTVSGYGAGIAVIGSGNTISGFRGMYNSNGSFSSGFGHQIFYDVYGNNNSAIGANVIVNSNSYRSTDTIYTSDINNTVISGSKIRNVIDVLGLRNDSIYIGKLRWLNTPPVNGSPTFYKFFVDSVAGTFTSQTYSHNVDTGFGSIVLNILPRISNTSVIGANATIDTSNQVVLGDTTAAQMKTGRWKWDIGNVPADGDVWTYNNTRKRWTTGALSSTFASKQNGQLMKFNQIGGSPTTNPIIAVNPAGWDQAINEIGNTIKVGGTYIMVYSGYSTPYVQDAVYIGLATSADGITWTKGGAGDGKILTTGSEDPYIVYSGGTYYLYVEKKVNTGTFHAGVQLFTSTNLTTWLDQGVVLDKGVGGTWEENDVSSPTVLLENGTWTMLYEGRSTTQAGAVGVATSTDGITWTKYGSNPVMGGTGTLSTITWALNTVPDDIFKIEGRYYMSFHGSHPSTYSGAMAVSTDLLSWKDYLGSWLQTDGNNESTGDGIMYYFDGNEYVANYVGPAGGIYRGRLVIKDDYALGSKAVSTTGTIATGAATVTGTLNVSGASTLAAITATTGTFSGVLAMPAGFTTNGNSNNIFVPSAQGGGSTGSSKFQVGTSTTLNFRRAYGGGSAVALAVNSSYAGSVFGIEDYTPAASGLHENGSTALVKTLTTTGGTAQTLFKYNMIIDGEPVGGIQNGSLWVKGRTKISKTFHGSATDTILVKRLGDSTMGGIAANELSFNASQITAGTLPISRGGLGLTGLGLALQQIRVNAGVTALEYFTPAAPTLDEVTNAGASTANSVSVGTLAITGAAVAIPGTYSYQNIKLNSTTGRLDRMSGELIEYVTLSTASIALSTAEYYINNTDVARTVVVPVATGIGNGRRYTIINSSNDTAGGAISQNITIDLTTNSVRVNGVSSNITLTPGQSITIVSNGAQWYKHQ